MIDGVEPPEFVGRLSRFEFDGVGAEPVASIGPGAGARLRRSSTPRRSPARLDKRREELRAEVERAERKLGNEGFVAKAPAEVVEEERGKLERYRAELAELGLSFDPDAYLDSLEPIGWRLGLERMHKLTTALGLPQHRFASIHVVGTNGKSSVARMTAALLEAHGVRSGACLSPHADRWSERTLIHGEEIGAAELGARGGASRARPPRASTAPSRRARR